MHQPQQIAMAQQQRLKAAAGPQRTSKKPYCKTAPSSTGQLRAPHLDCHVRQVVWRNIPLSCCLASVLYILQGLTITAEENRSDVRWHSELEATRTSETEEKFRAHAGALQGHLAACRGLQAKVGAG